MRPYGGLLAFSRSDWPHETKEPLSSDSRTFLAVHSHLFVCGQRVLVPGHTLWRRQQLRGTVARRCFQNVGRLREAFPPMGGVSACCCLTVLTADRRTSRGGLSGLGQHLSNTARLAGPILIPAGEAPLQEPNKKFSSTSSSRQSTPPASAAALSPSTVALSPATSEIPAPALQEKKPGYPEFSTPKSPVGRDTGGYWPPGSDLRGISRHHGERIARIPGRSEQRRERGSPALVARATA